MLEPIMSLALNDLAYEADWVEGESRIFYSARYTGASSDGTLYFRMRSTTQPHPPDKTSFGTVPRYWEVRIPLLRLHGESRLGIAAWRFGAGQDEVELRYYTVSDDGVLIEVKKPPDVAERALGFRAAISDL